MFINLYYDNYGNYGNYGNYDNYDKLNLLKHSSEIKHKSYIGFNS